MRIAQTLGGAFKIFADTIYEEALLADWDNKIIKKSYSEGANSEKGRISAIEYGFISKEWDEKLKNRPSAIQKLTRLRDELSHGVLSTHKSILSVLNEVLEPKPNE